MAQRRDDGAWMKAMAGQVVDSGYSLKTALSSFALDVCV